MPSTDPALALQEAFFTALKGQTPAGDNVFDNVPGNNPFPRITLGSAQVIGNSFQFGCIDGREVYLDVDCWSRAVGYPQVKQIADAVGTILHNAELTLDDHSLELLVLESCDYERDPDGMTSRARMVFRALTQPL